MALGHLQKQPRPQGFFTYSEFYHHNGHNKLLNQTLTVVALSESIERVPALNNTNTEETKNTSYSKTIESLTHLVEQSASDYHEQSKQLESKSSIQTLFWHRISSSYVTPCMR